MRYVIVMLLLGFMISCGDSEQTSKDTTPVLTAEEKMEAKRVEEVMAVHDEVMPKMANISRVRRELKDYLKNNPDLESEEIQEINSMVDQLDAADEGMMTWMGDWTDSQAEVQKFKVAKDHAAMMKFLEEQMKSITKVRDDMLQSIENGEELVKSLIEEEEEE